MRLLIRRWAKLSRDLWRRAKEEHSSPPEIGMSVAVGVFAGCTPFLGMHLWIALGLATVLRVNRLWAAVGSRFAIFPVFLWVTFCEIETGHRLRTGAWVSLAPHDALAHGRELFADWLIGTGIVGGAIAGCMGLAVYAAVRRWERRALIRRTLDAPRPPSSESPPSTPPAPTL